MSKIKEYFDAYPKSNECHETSDGFLFHEESDAKNHAKTLPVVLVKKHIRTHAAAGNKSAAAPLNQDPEDDIISDESPVMTESIKTERSQATAAAETKTQEPATPPVKPAAPDKAEKPAPAVTPEKVIREPAPPPVAPAQKKAAKPAATAEKEKKEVAKGKPAPAKAAQDKK